MRLVFAGAISVGLAAVAAANPRDFTINVKPVFQSAFSWSNAPVVVDVENRGPDAIGQIIASGDRQSTRYPVELPTGSKKRIVTYPSSAAYGLPPELLFDTDRARIPLPLVNQGSYVYGGMTLIALISDNAGDLGFLRQGVETTPNSAQATFGDAYCLPEDAPERPVGYQGLSTVVLGEGSDRLSDASIQALKSYTLTGGTVIFVGGASARTLNDPRWAGFIPGSNFVTKNVKGSRVLSRIQGSTFDDSMTVSSGKPALFAKTQMDGDVPMIMERGYGFGKVVLFAFNPFEDVLSRWAGRKRLFTQFARGFEFQRAVQYLAQFEASHSPYDPYSTGYPHAATTSGGVMISSTPQQSDPFSVELPGATKVFWILAAFFVAVVPINFFVLRKLGKGEWAWVTAPLISLGFAGIFLNQASDLYSARLSTATTGALIVHQGSPEAVFIGSTQMFFPAGGTYDLKMKDVDQLGSGTQDYYGRTDSSRTQVNPIDTGTIRISDLKAANLAFEEIGYRQRFSETPNIRIQSKMVSNGLVEVTVQNSWTFDLRNAAVIVAGVRHGLKALKPGESQTLQVPATPSSRRPQPNTPPGSYQPGAEFIEGLTIRQSIVALVSDIDGLKAGPQIGETVLARSSTWLVQIAPLPTQGVGQ